MITFEEFQSKAERVDVHPEKVDTPWTFALTGLLSETGKLSKIIDSTLPKGAPPPHTRAEIIDCVWKSLWYIAVVARMAGTSLDEAAQQGSSELDKIGDDFIPT